MANHRLVDQASEIRVFWSTESKSQTLFSEKWLDNLFINNLIG